MRCHGRIADGVRAARTVGAHRRLFHGRPRTGRAGGVFRHEVNGGAGRASPCGRPAARAPSPDKGAAGTGPVTGGRPFPRRAIPGRPPGSQDHGDIRGHRRARRVSERLTAARRPLGRLSPNVIDTTGPALPSPRGFSAIPEPARSVCQQTPRRTSSVYVRGGLWGGSCLALLAVRSLLAVPQDGAYVPARRRWRPEPP